MKKWRVIIPLAAAAMQMTGCSSIPATRSGDNGVSFDIASRQAPKFLHASAERQADETVIRGELGFPASLRKGFFAGTVSAIIDIPGRPSLVIRRIKVHREPIPKVTGGRGYFTIHTGQHLQPGSVVHLDYR